MGWKNVKEHYRIEHHVQVRDGVIWIGSSYIPDIIKIGQDGQFCKRYEPGHNADLDRYQREMLADMDRLKQLVQTPDTFEKAVTVWTYDGGDIIEKQCEKPGWPNVTHDGQMMYENTFSTDRNSVVKWAIGNAHAWVENAGQWVARVKAEMKQANTDLRNAEAAVEKLEAEAKSPAT